MPIILPDLKSLKKLQRQTRTKRGRAVKPPPKSEAELKRRLNDLWKKILFPATEQIKALIARGASAGEIAETIEQMLRGANAAYAQIAPDISDKWKLSLDKETRRATQSSLKAALGVDVQYILDEPVMVNGQMQTVEDALAIGSAQAASLIKTIPGEHLGKVARAVADNFAGRQDMPLLKKIQQIGGVTERRARIIARDQTAKMTADVVRIRAQSIGCDEYIWRTSRDNRVVGNPTGISPEGSKGHHDHWVMEGRHCKYSDPTVWSTDGKTWSARPAKAPKTGPGVEILCRCYGESVIDPVKIAEMAREG